jgi:hypothetical protein
LTKGFKEVVGLKKKERYDVGRFAGSDTMKRFEKPWRGREKAFLTSIVA